MSEETLTAMTELFDQALTVAAEKARWAALERAVEMAGLPKATCAEFMWMGGDSNGTQRYKHRDTRNYAVLRGTEDVTDCGLALNHARSVEERWGDRPKLSWERR